MPTTPTGFFLSWFTNYNLIGVVLALVFGAIWLACYWPPLFKWWWLWGVAAASAFLTLTAVAFVQIPLQLLSGQLIGQQTALAIPFIASIPPILLSGLVQEGAKLVPTVFYWLRKGRSIEPKVGLMVGAVAGAGFGVFEAIWAHNLIFASGFSWALVQAQGPVVLLGFVERFSAVAFHIGAAAIAGWGLAKGWGWQFYLIASFLHGLLNYSVVFLGLGVINAVQLEIYAGILAAGVTAVALWLRWRGGGTDTVSDVPEQPQPIQ